MKCRRSSALRIQVSQRALSSQASSTPCGSAHGQPWTRMRSLQPWRCAMPSIVHSPNAAPRRSVISINFRRGVMMREIPFGKPIIGDEERNAIFDVLCGTQLVHGPRAKQFEKDFIAYLGTGFATSVASCTAALHLAYFDRSIGPGDEVIVPSQTHVATAH